MAKVYNKKKNMYKGSLPGMRMGGVLRKAQTGKQGQFVDELGDTLGDNWVREQEGYPVEMRDQTISGGDKDLNVKEEYRITEDDLLRMRENERMRNDSLRNVMHHVSDSLHRDKEIKADLNALSSDNYRMELEIECGRSGGSGPACDELAAMRGQDKTPSGVDNIAGGLPEAIPGYKKGGVVKKKRGGTVLGGKYKMKKGGSTGRNGIL